LDDAIDFGRYVIPIVREEVAKRDAERDAERGERAPPHAEPRGGEWMTSVVQPPSSATELTVTQVAVSDPRVRPLLRELGDEYSSRYGKDAHAELARYPDEEFTRAHGGLLLLLNCEPGWITMLPSAELVMVTFVRVALPRAPLIARMPAPLLDLSILTLVIATFGMLPPPVLNWMPS
jgi:hypothetical protein